MPNILYAERGAEGLKLSYLSIPNVLKYNPTDKFSIATGVARDDLLSVKSDAHQYDDFKKDDWRIPVTLGYKITDHLSIGINYSFGLSDITPNDTQKMKNNWGSIALAYKIFSTK